MSPAKDSAKDLAQVAGPLTAVVGVITTLAVTGVLQRTQRDHGVWLLAGFACVLFAATIWLLATVWSGKGERPLQSLAAAIFAVGLGFAVVAVIQTQQEAERPSVSADFNPATGALTASVNADGLPPTQRIVIRVDGLNYGDSGKVSASNLYFGVLGANPDGVVSEPVHVTVPAGQYDAIGVKAWTGADEECSYASETTATIRPSGKTVGQRRRPGCIILTIPPRPASPTLMASWASGRILVLHVASTNNLGTVGLRAVGRMSSGTRILAAWTGNPDSSGKLNVILRLPVAADVRTICVEARFPRPTDKATALACPLHGKAVAATQVQLAVPG
ncbi:MAG TPA: hypothetical protein VGH82_10285 [Gaiellaceae bacterium]|jgi:hypothetical protein